MLLNNSEYLRNGFSDLGFDIFGSKTQIIPILIGDELTAVKFSRKLFENGVFAPCVRWPAVEKGAARIRFTVMATHTKNQLDRLLELCKELKGDLDIK
jgi:7-keto-8-aminopelargonate synthetase-like enzyme